MSRIVAVASGRGGVGETRLAITLAHALARVPETIRRQLPKLARHPSAPAARGVQALAQRMAAGL